MNNWQRYITQDNTYGSSFFPVHSVMDGVCVERPWDVNASSVYGIADQDVEQARAVHRFLSLRPDRSAD